MRAEQMATGTVIVYDEEAPAAAAVALYARVFSHEQKAQLTAQLGRPKLMKLLKNKDVSAIVVEHRDRVMRIGVDYVECAKAIPTSVKPHPA